MYCSWLFLILDFLVYWKNSLHLSILPWSVVTYDKNETKTMSFFQEMIWLSLAFNRPCTTVVSPKICGENMPLMKCHAHLYEQWGWEYLNTCSVLLVLSLDMFTHTRIIDVLVLYRHSSLWTPKAKARGLGLCWPGSLRVSVHVCPFTLYCGKPLLSDIHFFVLLFSFWFPCLIGLMSGLVEESVPGEDF